ncbi:MAG: flagellar hook-basal body complex protein FliE [Janthinobacterium lividum]
MTLTSLPAATPTSLFTPASASADSSSLLGTTDAAGSTGASFGQMLQSALGQVSGLQDHAAQMTTAFAQGKTSDIHSVMIATQQATMALQLTTQIRNKAVEAYQSIMQTSM